MKTNFCTLSLCVLVLLTYSQSIFAQGIGINDDNSDPDASAMLDVKSTNKGVLVPRMTTVQRTGITSPATGLLVFDTNTNTFWFYSGVSWTQVLDGTDSDNQDLSLTGNTLSLTNDGTTVNLAGYLDNTDNQDLSLAGNILSLTNDGTTVNLAGYLDNTDNQDLSNTAAGTNRTINITGGTGTTFSIADNDNSTTNEIQTLSIAGSNLSISGGNTIAIPTGITGSGTTDYLTKFTGATVVGNSLMRDNGTTTAINTAPNTDYQLYVYRQQQTADGDGQGTIYSYRTRNSRNDGTGYSQTTTNSAIKAYNYWGDNYTFGVAGFSWNDYQRTGGVMGAQQGGGYWGCLGYKNSGSATYGVYGSAGYASGGGFMGHNGNEQIGIGSGFYGGVMGGWTRGEVLGHTASGTLYASYNVGNEYTSGYQADILTVNNQRVAAYANTSTQLKVSDDGYAQLNAGEATVTLSPEFTALMAKGKRPVITVTAIGAPVALYVKNIEGNHFTIATTDGSTPNVEFAWTAVAKRVDHENAQLPEALRSSEFDNNIQGVMFNDNNKEQNATPIWWNGSEILFSPAPVRAIEKEAEESNQK